MATNKNKLARSFEATPMTFTVFSVVAAFSIVLVNDLGWENQSPIAKIHVSFHEFPKDLFLLIEGEELVEEQT